MINTYINTQDSKRLEKALLGSAIDVTVQYPNPLPPFKQLLNLEKPSAPPALSLLEKAYLNNDPESVKVLLEKVDIESIDQKKRTFAVLIKAIQAGRNEIVDAFLNSGKIDVLQKDKDNIPFSSLMLEIEYKDLAKLKNRFIHLDSVKPLLERRKKIIASITQKVLEQAPNSPEAATALYYQRVYNSI